MSTEDLKLEALRLAINCGVWMGLDKSGVLDLAEKYYQFLSGSDKPTMAPTAPRPAGSSEMVGRVGRVWRAVTTATLKE